jgi:hypothetical protein
LIPIIFKFLAGESVEPLDNNFEIFIILIIVSRCSNLGGRSLIPFALNVKDDVLINVKYTELRLCI